MYFILFTGLGIPKLWNKRIARVRESELGRTKVVLELSIILLITTFIGYVILYFTTIYP